MLFTYFDESMSSIGGYEPWRSCNVVDLTQYKLRMSSQQYHKDLITLTELMSFLLSFVL